MQPSPTMEAFKVQVWLQVQPTTCKMLLRKAVHAGTASAGQITKCWVKTELRQAAITMYRLPMPP